MLHWNKFEVKKLLRNGSNMIRQKPEWCWTVSSNKSTNTLKSNVSPKFVWNNFYRQISSQCQGSKTHTSHTKEPSGCPTRPHTQKIIFQNTIDICFYHTWTFIQANRLKESLWVKSSFFKLLNHCFTYWK